jgi:hypothetical protein
MLLQRGSHGDRTSDTRGRWIAGHVRTVMASTRRRKSSCNSRRGTSCAFQLRDGLIYIQGQVNGMLATLLVDTGAALTTFTLRVLPTLDTDSLITINMAKGSVLASRLPVEFILGDRTSGNRHCSFHQSAVVGTSNSCTQMASLEKTF